MTLGDWMQKNGRKAPWVATKVGVSDVQIYRYLNGTRRPSWGVMRNIIKMTDGAVTPDDFLDEIGSKKSAA